MRRDPDEMPPAYTPPSYAVPMRPSQIAVLQLPSNPNIQPKIYTNRTVYDLAHQLQANPQFHPNQLSCARNQRQRQRQAVYPRQHSNTFDCRDGAASLAAMEHMDLRGAQALPQDTGSDHSGGSDETVKIDDVIEYADA